MAETLADLWSVKPVIYHEIPLNRRDEKLAGSTRDYVLVRDFGEVKRDWDGRLLRIAVARKGNWLCLMTEDSGVADYTNPYYKRISEEGHRDDYAYVRIRDRDRLIFYNGFYCYLEEMRFKGYDTPKEFFTLEELDQMLDG